jgi:ADP-heptose:LPS heptosyltransferase
MSLTETRPRALLFRIGGLGDLLVALPSISLARHSLPGFSLTLVGRPEYGGLLEHCGLVDEVISFEDPRLAAVFGAKASAAAATGLLAEFGLAMGWLNRRGEWPADPWWTRQGVKRAFFTSIEGGAAEPISRTFFKRTHAFFSSLPAARAKAGPDVSRKTQQLRKSFGVPGDSPDFASSDLGQFFDECARLALPARLRKKALGGLRLRELEEGEKRLVVHPGSGGRAKRWPLPRFMEVIRRAASRGVAGVVVTGEAEADLEAALRELELPEGWTQVARLTAETLAGLVAGSTHYVGNDSGPTHLAAACGISVLALFREDGLPAWRPFGKTRVLAAASMPEIPLNEVLAALDDFL